MPDLIPARPVESLEDRMPAEPADRLRLDPDYPGVYVDADGMRVVNADTVTALHDRDWVEQERDQLDARAAAAEQALAEALDERDFARRCEREALTDLRKTRAKLQVVAQLGEDTADHAEQMEADRDHLHALAAELTAELEAARPVIAAARAWRDSLTGISAANRSYAIRLLTDAVDALPFLGSPPARAQGDGTLTRCCVHPGCPRTYRADVGPQDRGWVRLRGLTVLCPDHAAHAAQPATIAVEPPSHPAEHREDTTIPEEHRGAETAVIRAAVRWRQVVAAGSHPNLWADDHDFALIEAVDALLTERATAVQQAEG